jgi:hypothetical protein
MEHVMMSSPAIRERKRTFPEIIILQRLDHFAASLKHNGAGSYSRSMEAVCPKYIDIFQRVKPAIEAAFNEKVKLRKAGLVNLAQEALDEFRFVLVHLNPSKDSRTLNLLGMLNELDELISVYFRSILAGDPYILINIFVVITYNQINHYAIHRTKRNN